MFSDLLPIPVISMHHMPALSLTTREKLLEHWWQVVLFSGSLLPAPVGMLLPLFRVPAFIIEQHNQKQLADTRVYFILHFQVTVTTEGSQGRNLWVGADAETMKVCCWLACSLLAGSTWVHPGPSAQGWHHPQGLGIPTSTTKKMNYKLAYRPVSLCSSVIHFCRLA